MRVISLTGVNGTQSSKSNGKDNEYEYKFIMICRSLNLVGHQRIRTDSKFTTLKFKLSRRIYICSESWGDGGRGVPKNTHDAPEEYPR